MVDTSDEWITTRTGIKSRYISTGETTAQMAAKAAFEALQDSNTTGDKIQAIIGVTCSPDYYYPSLACIVSKEIGAQNPLAIDINCACSGFIYGIDLARRYLMDDEIEQVLIVCSEVLSKQADFTDRSTSILFGDGAAAMVVTKAEGLFCCTLRSESKKMESLYTASRRVENPWVVPAKSETPGHHGLFSESENQFIHMDGQEVYKFATKCLPRILRETCEKAGLEPTDLDLLIPHQANLRIIESAAKKLGFPLERIALNIAEYGNTSSVSIPLCIHEQRLKAALPKGSKVGLVGFGAGLTYGACILEIV
jgi:3-oxoacyl-[acyl-carrier-protein] synthase-3